MKMHAFQATSVSLILATAIGSFACGHAAAVELNTTPSGEAVVAPLWSTTGGHTTLVTLSNNRPVGASGATLLRLYDTSGVEQFSAIAYMGDGEQFLGEPKQFRFALSSDGASGTQLVFNDNICLLSGSLGSMQQRYSPIAVAANHGYLVAISIGTANDNQILIDIFYNDCASLENRWNTGDWLQNPTQGLYPGGIIDLQASMIDVEKGTVYQIPSTGLIHFSDVVQHYPPSSGQPNLASAHDAGTDAGTTTARRCLSGICETQAFDLPIDAVRFALSAPMLVADYNVDPNLGARTEIILTDPLNGRFPLGHPLRGYRPLVNATMSDRSGIGVARIGASICPGLLPPGGCPGFPVNSVSSVMLWRSDEANSVNASNELSGIPPINQPLESFAVMEYFGGDDQDQSTGHVRVSVDATVSLPYKKGVIGVVLQQGINAQLVDGEGGPVRANYGKAIPMRRVAD